MPNVASCEAMKNLLEEKQNIFWHDYEVIVAASNSLREFVVPEKHVLDE